MGIVTPGHRSDADSGFLGGFDVPGFIAYIKDFTRNQFSRAKQVFQAGIFAPDFWCCADEIKKIQAVVVEEGMDVFFRVRRQNPHLEPLIFEFEQDFA